jgi:hypothetical protein
MTNHNEGDLASSGNPTRVARFIVQCFTYWALNSLTHSGWLSVPADLWHRLFMSGRMKKSFSVIPEQSEGQITPIRHCIDIMKVFVTVLLTETCQFLVYITSILTTQHPAQLLTKWPRHTIEMFIKTYHPFFSHVRLYVIATFNLNRHVPIFDLGQ